jgi:hypothetical protein
MAVIVAELAAKLGLKVDKKSWSIGNDVIAGLGKALAVFAGYKLISSMKSMVESTLDVGDQAVKSAQKIGITAEAVQELSHAADASGTSWDELSAGMSKFAAGLQDVQKTGKGPVAEALQALKIHMRDLKGETLDQNLEVIANRFQEMPDGAKKTAIAMDLFGKSGRNLIPFLNQGQAGIAGLRNEAHELGIVIDEESAKQMEALNDNVDRVKGALIGLRNQAVVALLPTIKELVESLLAWVKANREMLSQKLASFVRGLAAILMLLGRAIAFVVEHWEIFAAILAGVAFVTAIVRIIKLIQFLQMASTLAAAKMLLAWAAAALPLVLIAAGVAALLLAITKYRAQVVAALVWIKDKFFAFGRWLKSNWYMLLVGPFVFLGKAIIDLFDAAWEKVKQGARDLWEYVKGLPGKVIDSLLHPVDADILNSPQVQELRRRMGAQTEATRPAATMPAPAGAGPLAFNVDQMNIQPPMGGDPQEYRAAVEQGITDWWAKERRHAFAGTGAA